MSLYFENAQKRKRTVCAIELSSVVAPLCDKMCMSQWISSQKYGEHKSRRFEVNDIFVLKISRRKQYCESFRSDNKAQSTQLKNK